MGGWSPVQTTPPASRSATSRPGQLSAARLLGQFRGGAAIVTVLACAFFTSFTGASGVTILALGGLLMPALTGAGYAERSTLGMVTVSGGLGLLFPPSLPLILHAIVASANAKRVA